MNKHTTQSGVTLIELTVVLLILIALAGLVVPYMGGTSSKALCDATDLSMQNIKKAIMGGGSGAAFYLDTLGYYPKNTKATIVDGMATDFSLKYLLTKPNGWANYDSETSVGWRGPYLVANATLTPESVLALAPNLKSAESIYGHAADTYTVASGTPYVHQAFANKDSVINDAWGRPIIIQVPTVKDCKINILGLLSTDPDPKEGYCARLVSAGSGNGLGIGEADIGTTLTSTRPATIDAADDRILYLNSPTPAADINPSCTQ
jgi:type II secretory pathway pseudopilin PulG